MGFFQLLCFFLCVIHACLTTAQLTYEHHFCEGANYTTNSPFHHNLNLLLSSLSSNTKNNKKFYSTTIGRDPPDKAYGIFHCRGDVTTEICKNCVESAIKDIIKLCPTQKESIIWHEFCMVRYSNRSIFSTLQEKPSLFLSKVNNVSNPDRFGAILEELMDDLINKAANGTSEAKFATGEASFMNLDKRYGLVQCTPDLTQSDCKKCLLHAVHGIPVCCSGKQGGRLIQPSCCLRYDIYPFYGSVVAAAPAPPPPLTRPGISVTNITNTARNAKKSSSIIVIIVVPSFIGFVLLYIIIIRFSSRRRKRKKVDNGEQITSLESLRFHFDTLEAATDNFSDANKLGKGGFGVVYKGRLSDGQEIAVKRLSRNSGQGEEQFKNEVLLVAKLQHRNLVKLQGFCIEGEEKLLIYEFVPNKSLDQFIFGLDHAPSIERFLI